MRQTITTTTTNGARRGRARRAAGGRSFPLAAMFLLAAGAGGCALDADGPTREETTAREPDAALRGLGVDRIEIADGDARRRITLSRSDGELLGSIEDDADGAVTYLVWRGHHHLVRWLEDRVRVEARPADIEALQALAPGEAPPSDEPALVDPEAVEALRLVRAILGERDDLPILEPPPGDAIATGYGYRNIWLPSRTCSWREYAYFGVQNFCSGHWISAGTSVSGMSSYWLTAGSSPWDGSTGGRLYWGGAFYANVAYGRISTYYSLGCLATWVDSNWCG